MYFRGFSYPACGPILIWLVPSALDLAPFNSTPGSAYGPSGSGRIPPEAKALLVFGRSLKAANLSIFTIWRRKIRYLCYHCKNYG